MVTTTVQMPASSIGRGGRQRPEHREQHDQDHRRVPLLGRGDVVFGGSLGVRRALWPMT